MTALRQIGIVAEEGMLAVLSHTSPISGTPPDSLCIALNKYYGRNGLQFNYRRFANISELKGKEPVIAIVKFSFMVDHYATVLEVQDRFVVVGDPIGGRRKMTYDRFRGIWQKSGIIILMDSNLPSL